MTIRPWRPLRHFALVVLALTAVVSPDLLGQGRRSRASVMVDGREAVDGEVLVRYRSAAAAFEHARAEDDVEADEVEPVGRRGTRRIRARRLGTREMLARLRANPDVEFAEPNYIIRLAATPNDPSFANLWGLFNFGQNYGGAGIAGADIDATLAWELTTGTRANVVGVIDTGIDYNHPDLAANIWTAPSAFSVTIGGVVINCAAGTHGFNAISNTCDPMDDHSHGTHVAGTIGAVGNNGVGVAGVNWTASMMGLKFLAANGSGTTSNAIKAIEFAVQAKLVLGSAANVRILSNSWGGGGYSQSLLDEINRANTYDMLFVAAAGNSGENADVAPMYPAAYSAPNIISVAATNNRDERASFSNYGAASVDLGAPGVAILSTTRNNSYSSFNGTSMATPHVSGAAALVLATCPMTTAQLTAALLGAVDPVAALAGITTTGGRLNLDAAVRTCLAATASVTASATNGTITAIVSGPGNPEDWLALYCPATSVDSAFFEWKFLNGTTTPPASGLQSATVAFSVPTGVNTCNVRLFWNDSYTKLATSETVAVGPPPTLTLTTPNVAPNGTISVLLENGPGNPMDWVGLFASSASDGDSLLWSYLNGVRVAPAAGLSTATLQFKAPAVAGSYDVRLFANNGHSKLATSGIVTIAPPPTLTINDVAVTEGQTGATSTAIFTVTLSPVNATQTVTVAYATADITATTGNNDYVAANGTLSFGPSVATRTFAVVINGDSSYEPNETFAVNLSSAVHAVLGDASGIVTIANDDVAPAPTLTVTTPTVASGGTVSVVVEHGPGNPADWISLFPSSAADDGSRPWSYLNGLRVVPTTGLSSAMVTFAAPALPGTYNFRLFANNGFTKLASSGDFTVAPPATPTLTVVNTTVNPGGTVGVIVENGPGNPTDWLGLFPSSSGDSGSQPWAYLNGLRTAPAAGLPGATVYFTAPTVPGTYNFRLFANNGFTKLASSGSLTVAPPTPPTLTLVNTTVNPGGTVGVIVENGPGNPTDWLGLFPSSSGDSGSQPWAYLNGLRTAPATGLPGATVYFTAPTVPGTYNLRLFANNGFTKLATSGIVTVSP